MAYDTERVFPGKQIAEIIKKWITDFDDDGKMNFILEDIEELLDMNQRSSNQRRDNTGEPEERRAR